LILVLNIVLLVAIVLIFYTKASHSQIKNHFFIALSIKLISGILLGVLYFQYYGFGDTLLYHEAARYLSQQEDGTFRVFISLFGQPEEQVLDLFPILKEPRSAFFIKIVAGFYLLTSGSYWLTSIYLSLVSFIGSWFLTGVIIRVNPAATMAAVVSFLYFPTFVFWTSGVLKESIAWCCLSVIMGFIVIYFHSNKLNVRQLLMSIVLLFILWSIKYHYVAVLALCFFPILLSKTLRSYTRVSVKLYPVFIGVFFIMVILMFSHPNFKPERLMTVIQENHEMIKEISDQDKTVQFIEMGNPYFNFLLNIPISLFAGLFMPLPWQGMNILVIATGILNFILLIFFIKKLFSLSINDFTQISSLNLSMALYIIIMAILMAYTTPNFGTLERYKISYIGFFIFWVFYGNSFLSRIFMYRKQ
jgi:hypothetical protein